LADFGHFGSFAWPGQANSIKFFVCTMVFCRNFYRDRVLGGEAGWGGGWYCLARHCLCPARPRMHSWEPAMLSRLDVRWLHAPSQAF
jgi:hypothetical protein